MRITVAQTINLGWDCVAPSALFRWNMSATGAVRRGEWAMSPERAVVLFSPGRSAEGAPAPGDGAQSHFDPNGGCTR